VNLMLDEPKYAASNDKVEAPKRESSTTQSE
jgi:hypothetical protein